MEDLLIDEFADKLHAALLGITEPGPVRRLLRAGRFELALVPALDTGRLTQVLAPRQDGKPAICVTIQFYVYDAPAPGAEPMIRDIKEQELWMGRGGSAADVPRLEAFWRGLQRALGALFLAGGERVEFAMPHELIPLKLLERRSFTTAEQFAQAALGKSYLGKLAPAPLSFAPAGKAAPKVTAKAKAPTAQGAKKTGEKRSR